MHSQRFSTRHPLQVSFPVRLLHAAFVGISVLIPLGMLTLATAWPANHSTDIANNSHYSGSEQNHRQPASPLFCASTVGNSKRQRTRGVNKSRPEIANGRSPFGIPSPLYRRRFDGDYGRLFSQAVLSTGP